MNKYNSILPYLRSKQAPAVKEPTSVKNTPPEAKKDATKLSQYADAVKEIMQEVYDDEW